MTNKALNILALVVLVGCLAFSSYMFLDLWPQITGNSVTFFSNESGNYASVTGAGIMEMSSGMQFYPNMRYENREISYWIEGACSGEKRQKMISAFFILSDKTRLKFYERKDNPEILVLCSEVAPESFEEGHFIAGEGGPSRIINATDYTIILSGKIAIFREEKCDSPQVELHELLHALGFDHRTNKDSILYPVTDCNQKIDQEILDEIDRLYAQDPLADLYFRETKANMTGRYVNFEVIVANKGIAESGDANLEVYGGSEFLKSFDVGNIDIGSSKEITVQNLRVPAGTEKITFLIKSGAELDKSNNKIEMTVKP